mmetsp:Transcript_25010/g.77286  ORF Transcript_25010/g.77286 Transcript_25010/m.77286 type:complete len:271 (-) Transcript_25010:2170-2982(-)
MRIWSSDRSSSGTNLALPSTANSGSCTSTLSALISLSSRPSIHSLRARSLLSSLPCWRRHRSSSAFSCATRRFSSGSCDLSAGTSESGTSSSVFGFSSACFCTTKRFDSSPNSFWMTLDRTLRSSIFSVSDRLVAVSSVNLALKARTMFVHWASSKMIWVIARCRVNARTGRYRYGAMSSFASASGGGRRDSMLVCMSSSGDGSAAGGGASASSPAGRSARSSSSRTSRAARSVSSTRRRNFSFRRIDSFCVGTLRSWHEWTHKSSRRMP